MDVEKVFKAIDDWYDCDPYVINCIVDEPEQDEDQTFEFSNEFEAVVGWQKGDESGFGQGHHGEIYFLLKSGKWVKTTF